jgi:hypothetical protein
VFLPGCCPVFFFYSFSLWFSVSPFPSLFYFSIMIFIKIWTVYLLFI